MAQFLTNENYGNGSDGNYDPVTGTDAPIDSACTGTINTTSLSATNGSFAAGQMIMIHQTQGTGVGQWELNVIASYSGGTITTKYPLTYSYASGAQVLVLKQYLDAEIDTGKTISLKAWDGTVGGIYPLLSQRAISIVGTINANHKGFRGSTKENVSAYNGPTGQGEGTVGAGNTNSYSANGNGGGGGDTETIGNTTSSGGGGAGHVAAGSNGTGTGGASVGAGGNAVGNSSLTSMNLGGGGGGGEKTIDAGLQRDGGDGGGIVFLMSKTITITGAINSTGEDAEGGGQGQGAGGAAGGSVLIKGQVVDIGTNKIVADKGDGSPGALGNGGNGSLGRIHTDWLTSLAGSSAVPVDTDTEDSTLQQQEAFGGVI